MAFAGVRFLVLMVVLAVSVIQASAIEPIKISKEDTALDLSRAVELLRNKGESVQVSTAPVLTASSAASKCRPIKTARHPATGPLFRSQIQPTNRSTA